MQIDMLPFGVKIFNAAVSRLDLILGGWGVVYILKSTCGYWLGVCVITHLLFSRKRESPGPFTPTQKLAWAAWPKRSTDSDLLNLPW